MTRRRKFDRPDEPPPMRMTPRAVDTLKIVYAWRYATIFQIQALLFPSYQVAARWVKKLWQHGFLYRISIPIYAKEAPLVPHCLDERGVKYLAGEWGMSIADMNWKPDFKKQTYEGVQHTILINQMRTVVTCLAGAGQFELQEWIDDFAFHSPQMKDKLPFYIDEDEKSRQIRPDGYFRIRTHDDRVWHFFLEADRHTETHAEFAEKVKAYEYSRLYGHIQQHFGSGYFRVLNLFLSEKRAMNMAETISRTVSTLPAESRGNDAFYWNTWETKLDLFRPESFLDAIWNVPQYETPQLLFK